MTEVAERDPAMMPTIVRRVDEDGRIFIMERIIGGTPEGDVRAVCVFWSLEHARRDMYANGCYPEDGWKAIERDRDEMALLFDVLDQFDNPPKLAYIEPAPGVPELSAVLRPEEFLELLDLAEAAESE